MAALQSELAVAVPSEGAGSRIVRSLDIWIPLGFLCLIVAACFLGPLIVSMPSPTGGQIVNANLPPLSPGHLFGTDQFGSDVFSRIIYGGRVSIEVGFAATAIGVAVGGLVGAVAGVLAGLPDSFIMRVVDVLLAFPPLVLLLVVSEYLGPSELHVIWTISFFTVPSFARIARAATIQIRSSLYFLAARLSGSGFIRVVVRHAAPNIAPQLMTFGLLGISGAILFEAALSFLGLGVPPPHPSWGNMINAAQEYVTVDPVQVIIPSGFLVATILALNLLGDALRARWSGAWS